MRPAMIRVTIDVGPYAPIAEFTMDLPRDRLDAIGIRAFERSVAEHIRDLIDGKEKPCAAPNDDDG